MFKTVLVANRGEIAVRVIRTLRELGIRSVAVHSEADAEALHVRLADESHCIGPAAPRESYLDVEKMVDVCLRSGAEAVHPGYGFLSENEEFVEACSRKGIAFIGPQLESVKCMGSKIEARRRMMEAGVPVVPGMTMGMRTLDKEALERAANEIGYPLLVKASYGGGGRGMRRVQQPGELHAACHQAQSEAENAFGDPEIYLEKEVVGGRHVEVQILGDAHGHCVHLFERDCSMQRRHQKILEETSTPARAQHPAKVDALCDAAVRAAKAVDYVSAGTVEFLFAHDGSFYFLEMNTRLQVEHPITELVTGIDLVREQVRIASGEPLGYAQSEIKRRGHAIECRLYAEDPGTNFMPSPGPLNVLHFPQGQGIRVDEGYETGDRISAFYDSMILKLSVWAPDRQQAVRRMQRALRETRVTGTQTNLQYLRNLVAHSSFVEGAYDVGFVSRHHEEVQEVQEVLGASENRTSADWAAAAAAAVRHFATTPSPMVPRGELGLPEAHGMRAMRNGSPAGTGSGVSRWRTMR